MKNLLISKLSLLFFFMSIPYIGISQISMVKDINIQDSNAGSSFYDMVDVNGTLFFMYDNHINGGELWKSDGTEAGTIMVKDIRLGKFGSDPSKLLNINGILYFSADDGIHGRELWKSDGTQAGTVMVKNINLGNASSLPSILTNVDGVLFFAATDGVHGKELWKSDGTEAGTVMIKNISESTNDNDLTNITRLEGLTEVNGVLFFIANDEVHGRELWKSDGTEAGTVMVKDIILGVASSDITLLKNVNGTLFFVRHLGGNLEQLWKSDGTSAGTVMIKQLTSSTNNHEFINNLTTINNLLFFTFNDYTHGNELWKSDGTEAGTVMVKDIRPGNLGGCYRTNQLIALNNQIYFRAYNDTDGGELWKSDGTEAGTVMVKDIRPGIESIGDNDLPITNVNGTLFFSAAGNSNGAGIENIELWKSDGTDAGTVMVKDIKVGVWESEIESLVGIANRVFFMADDGVHGKELWKSDGTEVGTMMVRDLYQANSSANTGFYTKYVTINNTMFFIADDGGHGRELWKSDGTEAGTVMVKDINSGSGNSDIAAIGTNEYWLTDVNGTLFFAATGDTYGNELWKSDGTETGTVMVKDIQTVPSTAFSSTPEQLINVNGTLFFTTDDRTHGRELWKSDGTEAGTVMVKDIKTGGYESNITSLTNVNGTVFFAADDGAGQELWKSDGTEAGTVMVKDGTHNPQYLVCVNNTVYFSAIDGLGGRELWKSDGTEAGTAMVKDIKTGSTGSYPSYLTNVNGTVFFVIYTGVGYRELWKSDGTEAGTMRVKDFSQMVFDQIENLVTVNNTLFFSIKRVGYGSTELWKSDGTEMGTVKVKSISMTNPFVTPNGKLFFTSSDEIHGAELWKSDGTEAGTVMIADVCVGKYGSGAKPVAYINDTLFFTANDGPHGRELWRMLPCPSITLTSNLSNGLVNTPYNQSLTQTGLSGTIIWETMGLPLGLSINANTGEISGIPTIAGTFNITITIKDGNCSITKNYTLVINCPTITFNNTIANSAVVGTPYNLDASVNVVGNSSPITYSVTSSLPAGLSINPATGQISGIPTNPKTTANYTVRAIQNNGCFKLQTYSFAVVCPNMIINGTLPNGIADVAYSTTLVVSNSPNSPTWFATGLPNGLSMNANTGEISGTSTLMGTFNITVTVKSSGCTASKSYTLVINCPTITFNNTSIPSTAVVGNFYSINASVNVVGNSSPITYSMLSFLPAGLSINSATGQISGIPMSSTSMSSYTVKASQSNGCFKTYIYSFAVVCPSITINGGAPNGVVDVLYSTSFTISGSSSSPVWFATGLPNGLSMNANTGEISGMPATMGSFNIVVTAKIYNCSKSQNYTLVISCPTITFNNTFANSAAVGAPYNLDASVNVIGNSSPITYSVTPELPFGLSINPSTGQISGIPTSPKTTGNYMVKALQGNGCLKLQTYTFAVFCPNMTINGILPNGFVDVLYSSTFSVSGSPIWSAAGLPSGLSMNANTGEISGIPDTTGTFDIVIKADINDCSNSQNYTLVIGILEASQSILLFPNPADTEISVNVRDWRNYEWNMKDISGRTLKQGIFEGVILKIDLSNTPSGTYILEVKNKNLVREIRFIKI